ncbi:hypothetical protein C8Q73DRAFT_787977 [Cubamyces lactineus]|nr:hypothetical protein C8Q73DRAFT_787977 [Cubamyces lactineus]
MSTVETQCTPRLNHENIDMSSYYSSPPSSPIASFFPTGPASPHAFSSFQQDPRDTHAMYAALAPSSRHNTAQGQATLPRANNASQTGSLKRMFRK